MIFPSCLPSIRRGVRRVGGGSLYDFSPSLKKEGTFSMPLHLFYIELTLFYNFSAFRVSMAKPLCTILLEPD